MLRALYARLALALGLLLLRLLTRRTRHLGRTMEAFRASDFTRLTGAAPERPAAGDEIDRLEATFRAMAERITDQIQALTEQDRLCRDLVAQVSHDLRTPLASLRGYLETLRMKDGQLAASERVEYLDIALRHSLRLSRLVEDLFELIKLDARDVRPYLEPVSLGELAQDVVQKLDLTARRKGVHLRLAGDRAVPFVRADTGLIEPVLENLIGNAIQHTPADGEIRVTTRVTGPSVTVEVADTGRGIPAEVLPRIFDDFFQAPSNRADDRHAGLGLAIAKRILDIHESRLTVASSEEAGSRFSFALPVWTGGHSETAAQADEPTR